MTNADVAELADALDLGSSSERSEGSSPFIRTKIKVVSIKGFRDENPETLFIFLRIFLPCSQFGSILK